MFIDTHAHINFAAFKDDSDEVIRRSLENDIWMILIGSEFKTSNRALSLANKYEKGVYASVGLHPIHLSDSEIKKDQYGLQISTEPFHREFNLEAYRNLAKFEKVVAIGETGLDYHHLSPNGKSSNLKKKQKEVFWQQLILARELDLPVIIHCRQAHDDLLSILQDFKKTYPEMIPGNRPWGVMHCFSGDEDLAWKYFSLGLLISFTGLITFSQNWDDLLRKIPLDKLMIETDAPYMTPEPYRGQRNEPMLVQYVANRIAEIRGIKLDKVAEITSQNARHLFKI